MEVALGLVALTVAVCGIAAACDRFGWPTPLVLVTAGAVVSFLPLVPSVELEPELVLNGLLPPLLYATTARTSLFDFRRNKLATVLMSVVLVVFTTLAVGWTTSLLLPGVALAACMALGAVVAPPDAVAAAALGRRLGLPRRVATLLEEESLVNDATALITLGVAVAALTSTPSPLAIAGEFVLAVVGALVVGAVVSLVLISVRRHIRNPVLDTVLSFVAPYLAFVPAEAVHASGVLAVVVTGLAMAQCSPAVQTAASRLAEATNWRTIAFLLENAVFLLIGLQLPRLVADAADSDLTGLRIVAVCAAVLAATIVSRFVFVGGVAGLLRLATVASVRRLGWSRGVTVLVSWAGMRGVVTLAAAQLLPEDVPQRPVLLLAAFAVVVGTLLVQGSTLPWVVRRVGLPAPDPAEDALQAAALGDAASVAGLRRLAEVLDGDEPEHTVTMLKARSISRSHAAWERLGRPLTDRMTPSARYADLRQQMLAAERAVVVHARDTGTAEPEVLQAAMTAIDFEEALLDRVEELDALEEDRGLALRTPEGAGCAHLRTAPAAAGGPVPDSCPDCVREGSEWVHLRTCLACGYTACCDSSPLRHARRHHASSAHPVIISAEPGEAWRWCWVDELLG